MSDTMNTKSSIILGGCIIIASAILAAAVVMTASTGRYQVGGVPGHAYVIDTTTGKVWEEFAPDTRGSSDPGFKDPKPK